MWPAIAMDAQGGFAITWTSFGQGTDQPYDGNIYVKKFW